jgi:predicted ribonuclease YlaK
MRRELLDKLRSFMSELTKSQRRQLRRQGVIDVTAQKRNSAPERGLRIKKIEPRTLNQQLSFDSYNDGNHLLLHGMAGTGKTFISMYLALKDVLSEMSYYNKVVVVRSIVPTRDIGFLPGKENDKMKVYEDPYRAICNELFSRGDAYDILKHKGYVDFISTSFIRGMTLNDCIVIVDEINNLNFHELDSIITRLGENCRILFCGDFRQSDLTKQSERNGLTSFMKIVKMLNNFSYVEFTEDDIVRSNLVKQYIITRERLGICA